MQVESHKSVVFCNWLVSFSIRVSTFIHNAACISSSFLFVVEKCCTVWIYHTLFSYLLTVGYLGCFHLLTIMNSQGMSFQGLKYILISLGCIYLEVELPGHMVIVCLNFWVTMKPFSKVSGLFYIPISRVLIYWYPCQQLSSDFLILAILVSIK